MIKFFEEYDINKQYFYDLVTYLEKFIESNIGCDINVIDSAKFYYSVDGYNVEIFQINKSISGIEFDFFLTINIRTKNKSIPSNVSDIVLYIYDVLKKDKYNPLVENKVKDIPDIISNITTENYEIYLAQKDYNL